MTTGRCITDLAAGDHLGSLDYQISPFVVREHCHAAELHREIFHGGRDGVQAWPMGLVFADKLKLFAQACPGGDGPQARVLGECRAEWWAPVHAGDRVSVEGRVVDRFQKRGRDFIDIEVLLRNADGKTCLRFSDTAAYIGAEAKPAGQGSKPAAAQPPSPSQSPEAVRSDWRRMTAERIRWFCDAQETAVACDGKTHISPTNIHNDDAFAKSQGLPGLIGFGMSSMNWIFGFLIDRFGEGYLARGALTTKFVRPVMVDQLLSVGYRERGRRDAEGARDLDVWCVDDKGQTVAAGSAKVYA